MAVIARNSLREKLDINAPTLGTHFLFNDPDIPELIGDSGLFDYAEFTAECSTFDMKTLYHLARAAQCGGDLPLMIKLDQESQGFWALAALGAGFKAILFTDIRSTDDIDECHRIVAPDTPSAGGRRGLKDRRPAFPTYDPPAYLADLESIVVAIMIEKNTAVDALDDVLARAQSKGVLMTQWGPGDFGFSRGEPELMRTPAITPFEELVIKKSFEHGLQPRIEIGAVEQAKRYIDLGVRHFCIGWDRWMYQAALDRVGEGMRELLETV